MSRQDKPQTHPNLDAPIEVVADPSLSKQEKAKALWTPAWVRSSRSWKHLIRAP